MKANVVIVALMFAVASALLLGTVVNICAKSCAGLQLAAACNYSDRGAPIKNNQN